MFKDYIASKTLQSFDTNAWLKISEIKNPDDFKPLFYKQVNHFSLVCLQNGIKENNPEISLKILQIACLLAYCRNIDTIFNFEKDSNLIFIKEEINRLTASQLIQLSQKILQQA